jgi:hypothetical protein
VKKIRSVFQHPPIQAYVKMVVSGKKCTSSAYISCASSKSHLEVKEVLAMIILPMYNRSSNYVQCSVRVRPVAPFTPLPLNELLMFIVSFNCTGEIDVLIGGLQDPPTRNLLLSDPSPDR